MYYHKSKKTNNRKQRHGMILVKPFIENTHSIIISNISTTKIIIPKKIPKNTHLLFYIHTVLFIYNNL